jgi:hypothetical protein
MTPQKHKWNTIISAVHSMNCALWILQDAILSPHFLYLSLLAHPTLYQMGARGFFLRVKYIEPGSWSGTCIYSSHYECVELPTCPLFFRIQHSGKQGKSILISTSCCYLNKHNTLKSIHSTMTCFFCFSQPTSNRITSTPNYQWWQKLRVSCIQ